MCAMINSTIADALFGSKNSINSGSLFSASSLGDWGMMKSGVYTKMLKSYYDKTGDTAKTEKTSYTNKNNEFETEWESKLGKLKSSADEQVLSSIKSTAQSMGAAAKELSGIDFDKSSREDLYKAVKKMTDSYNAVVSNAAKTNTVSISQSVTWMQNDTKAHESQLANVGISIGSDGTLSVDEKKFADAGLSDIKALMEGNTGYAGRLSQKAAGLYNLATNQISYNQGKTLYSSSGILG